SSERRISKFWFLVSIMRFVGVILFLIYIVVPLAIRFSATVQRHLIFLPFLRYPYDIDLTKPADLGIEGAVSLRIPTESKMELGAWYIPPKTLASKKFEDFPLDSGHPVFVYLHGNSGSRANGHRIELYKLLQELDYHIITFDYRGYADSSPVPITEDTVVTDSHNVIRFVEEKKGGPSLFIWGHSLGTGVGSRVAAEMCQASRCPKGLILESPFNNLRDEIRFHPFTYIYRYMPFFEYFFLDGMPSGGMSFTSDTHIADIMSPVMILHAEDDAVVPFHLGKKLFESASQSKHFRSSELLKFVGFESKHQYGHKFICRAPQLSQLVKDFVNLAIIEPAVKSV
ncbi:hypothetical protein QYM36_014815, partial [Artemia franciscana]